MLAQNPSTFFVFEIEFCRVLEWNFFCYGDRLQGD